MRKVLRRRQNIFGLYVPVTSLKSHLLNKEAQTESYMD